MNFRGTPGEVAAYSGRGNTVVSNFAMKLTRILVSARRCSPLLAVLGQTFGRTDGTMRALHALVMSALPAVFLLRTTREEIYNILWSLVFGFATLNILGLGAKRLEQTRGLSFGEILAILVVIVSIVLLGWEMLYLFHILPIRLTAN